MIVTLLFVRRACDRGGDRREPPVPGSPTSPFEQRVPDQVQRYAFDRAMLEPFVQLGTPPGDPICRSVREGHGLRSPGLAFLIGYQTGECVIAFLDRRAPASPAMAAATPRLVRLSRAAP